MLVRKYFVQSPRAGRNIEGGGWTAAAREFNLVLREVVRNLDKQGAFEQGGWEGG